MEKVFPDTNMPDMRPFILYSINSRPPLPKLINYKTTHKPTPLRPSFAKLKLIMDQPTTQPIWYFFYAGDIIILPSRLLLTLTRVWCHIIMNMFSLSRATKSTAVWQYDSCVIQGCTYIYDGVCIFIYGACNTTQGLNAVLLRVGIM